MPRLARIFSSSLLALTASFFIGSTILGAIRDYCSVPYWDMWDSYIRFYEKVSKGDLYFWWEPHMEHRILIPRIFFWLDIKYFHGLSLLLIPLNITLIVMLWGALWSGALLMFKARLSKIGLWNVAWLLAVVCFSWMQRENIINGFQNVFFFALLLPLLGFQCLSLAHLNSRSWMWFGLALLFGVASIGTLASGVFALPLMVLLALIQGQSRAKIAILAVISIVAFAIYQIGTPPSTLLNGTLRAKPDALMQFFLVYVGGPLRVITNDYLVAAIAGAGFVAGSVICGWCAATRRETNPMFLAFTAFVAYVLATALATTIGRAAFGIVGTTPGRYSTPVLIGWAVLAILLSFRFQKDYRFPGVAFSGAVLLPLFLLPSQLDAIYGDFGPIKHQRLLGVLALALNVNDKQAIGSIYPDDRIFASAQEAKRRRLSVFGLPIFKDLPHYIGHPVDAVAVQQCQGAVDSVSTVNGQTGVSRVAGWAFDSEKQRIPEEIFFVDPENKIIGAALTGRFCGAGCGNLDKLAGFDGYVMGDPKHLRIFYAPQLH